MRQQTTTTEIMEFLRDHMATKEDLKDIRFEMATRDDLIRSEMATKDDLANMESRLIGHIVGFTKSVDTFDTELTAQRSRIDRLERRTGIIES
jgi:hypothetical protein